MYSDVQTIVRLGRTPMRQPSALRATVLRDRHAALAPEKRKREPLARGLSLIRWALDTRTEEIGVRAAADALKIAPSTAHSLMSALVAEGFLRRNANATYGLGHELLMLAHKAADRLPLSRIALPHMRTLVARCNEAAFLNVYNADRQEFFAIANVESTQVLRYVVEMNKWKPVYVSAGGWAIMAHLPKADRDEICARTKLKPLTPFSITDPEELEKQLAVVRERGYALSHSQRIPGAVGLSAPLIGPGGHVLGGIGISLPETRFKSDSEGELSRLLLACTSAICRGIRDGDG